jgi:signal transduction histidine kinase
MALRYGGRHELEGGNELLIFPAEGAGERSEREALRKELDEVRRQSEVYARELAAVFDRGEEVTTTSTAPPPLAGSKVERFAALTKVCAGIASDLQSTIGPMAKDVGALRRHEVSDEQLEKLRHRMQHARATLASITSIGSIPADELQTEIDLADCVRHAVKDAAAHAEREGVTVNVSIKPNGARPYVRRAAKATAALARELVHHAINASPRGSAVEIQIQAEENAARVVVDDAGSALPASARRSFLLLETHAGAYGRPSGLPIFMAAELAVCLGAQLELSDAPIGGLRVAVTFPKA